MALNYEPQMLMYELMNHVNAYLLVVTGQAQGVTEESGVQKVSKFAGGSREWWGGDQCSISYIEA